MLYTLKPEYQKNLAQRYSHIYIIVEGKIYGGCSFTYEITQEKLLIDTVEMPKNLQQKGISTAIYKQLLVDFPNTKVIKSEYMGQNRAEYWLLIKSGKTHQEALENTPSGKIIMRTGLFVLDLLNSPNAGLAPEDDIEQVVWIRKQ